MSSFLAKENTMKRWIALALCLCMLAALVGCGGSQIEKYDDPAQAVEPAEGENAGDANTQQTPASLAADPGQSYAAYPPDMVVAVINGTSVTWEEYHYWLYYFVQYVQMMALQSGQVLSGWDTVGELSGEYTNGKVVLLNAQDSVLQYHVMESLAAELGVTLSEEDEATVLEIYEQQADAYVGDGDGVCTEQEAAAFEDYLGEQFISRDFFDYMNEVALLSNNTFLALSGENGEDLPDEDALAFADQYDIVAAKHILLLTVDPSTGEALSEEQIAEKRALIDDLYAQLTAVADDQEALGALFDQLMDVNTEDSGYDTFPDGYAYVPGTMVPEFEDAVTALEEYGLSEVVETDYGYHIIQRIPVEPGCIVMDTTGQAAPLRAWAADDGFYGRLRDAMDNADVVWSDGFEELDMTAVFGG